MNDADRQLWRRWQQIAARASNETDPQRLAEVLNEIRDALKIYSQTAQTVRKSLPR